jgi:hypothetical protein
MDRRVPSCKPINSFRVLETSKRAAAECGWLCGCSFRAQSAFRERKQLGADGAEQSWNVILRLYGLLQSWFDKTWRPGDIEEVK